VSRRGDTRLLILGHLAEERQIGMLIEHLHNRHGISAGAVRQQIWRMVQEGAAERLAPGRYRRIKRTEET
jgi:hypothetical protein